MTRSGGGGCSSKKKFPLLFILVSIAKLLEIYDKKAKEIFFNGKNGGETVVGYTFHADYTYCTDCTPSPIAGERPGKGSRQFCNWT
jgi:hypothetical protein